MKGIKKIILGNAELLTNNQMKLVFGGSGTGYDGGTISCKRPDLPSVYACCGKYENDTCSYISGGNTILGGCVKSGYFFNCRESQ